MVWTCLSKFTCWKLNPQCHRVERYEAFRRCLHHEGSAFINGWRSLLWEWVCCESELGPSLLFCLLPWVDAASPGPQQMRSPWPYTSQLQNCNKYISVLYKLPGLRCSILAAQSRLRPMATRKGGRNLCAMHSTVCACMPVCVYMCFVHECLYVVCLRVCGWVCICVHVYAPMCACECVCTCTLAKQSKKHHEENYYSRIMTVVNAAWWDDRVT